MNLSLDHSEKCSILSHEFFFYQSSEQYIIICLRICNLIINKNCHIKQLIDFKNNATIQSSSSSIKSYNDRNLSFYMLPQLLSDLNETECRKYAFRESYKLSLFVCGCILCLLILCLNLTTLITIIRSKRLHTVSNILIANLSIADFLLGIAFLYPCALNLLTIKALETYDSNLYALACNIRQYYYLCLVGYSPMITSMLSSIQTLTILAGEKYISVLHPYTYERLIQDRKFVCYLCLVFVWMISIFFSLLPMLGWNEYNYSSYRGFTCNHAQSKPCMFERIFTLEYILCFTSICVICALAMLVMYIRIYLIACDHLKQINQMNAHVRRSLSWQNFKNIKKIEADKRELDNIIKMPMWRSSVSHSPINSTRNVCKKDIEIEKVNEHKISRFTVDFCTMIIQKIRCRLKRIKFIKNSYSLENLNFTMNQTNGKAILHKYSVKSDELATVNSSDCLHISYISDSKNFAFKSPLSRIDLVQASNDASSHITTKNRINSDIRSSMKAIKTILILCFGFYICWLPLIIYFLTFASKQYDNLTIYILMFVACCNAVIDPLVYAFNNREFCRALFFSRQTT